MAHTITAKPDFDQILEVQTAMPPGDRALVLTVPGQDNNHPISAPAMIKVSHPGGSLFLSLLRTLYLEEGELSF